MNTFYDLFLSPHYAPIFGGVTAFLISTCFYLYPSIIDIAKQKGLMDVPDFRKMHKSITPTLGGLGIFIAFSLTTIFYSLAVELSSSDFSKLLGVLGAIIILVFLGLKDDLVEISAKKKIVGQLVAVLCVILLTDVRIFSFEGLLGFGVMSYAVSILFSVFVFVLVINALNLIDGIDGLAGLVSIVASTIFGVMFFVQGHFLLSLMSSVFIGAIVGFLRYNLSSSKKIFMGDSGSMLAGFLLAYQAVSLLGLNENSASIEMVANAPVLVIAVLSYPLFDLLRVFVVRIREGRSPFDADANHIHHRLLRLGLDHKEASVALCLLNVLVIGVALMLNSLEIHIHLALTLGIGIFLYLVPFLSVFREQELTVSKISEERNADEDNYEPSETAVSRGILISSVVHNRINNAIAKESINLTLRNAPLLANPKSEFDYKFSAEIGEIRTRELELTKRKLTARLRANTENAS